MGEKCDAWLNVGAMGRTRAALCERDRGHEDATDEPPRTAHFGDGVLWIDEAEHAGRGPLPPDPLRDVITTAADAYATEHDHVVVLDDVVADEIARKVRDWFGSAR